MCVALPTDERLAGAGATQSRRVVGVIGEQSVWDTTHRVRYDNQWEAGIVDDGGHIAERVGRALRMLRERRRLSLDQVAQLTAVSKPMLGQIERGITNPSVLTLWKIAHGFGVPFSMFLDDPSALDLVRRDDQPLVTDDEGRYRIRTAWIRRPGDRFEWHLMELEPKSTHLAEPHAVGVEEWVLVIEGGLTIRTRDVEHRLREGDLLHFAGDFPHTYANPSTDRVRAHILIMYRND